MTQKIKFGEIWLADLNPYKGTEPGKIRPVLIMQNQFLLDVHHPSTLIIPLTTNIIENALPLRIHIKAQDNLEKDSDVLIDQLRAIDNKRLIQGPLTCLNQHVIYQIQKAILDVIDYRETDSLTFEL